MSSTPDDGEVEQHAVEEAPHITHLPDETLPLEEKEIDAPVLDHAGLDIEEDVDTIPQLEAHTQPEGDLDAPEQDEIVITEALQPAIRLTGSSPRPGSLDSASIPDDTPSVQDSGVSSPKSDVQLPPVTASRQNSTTSRRPFELRFQSRLSSSYLNTPRSSSPAFLNAHSRNSSLASLGPPSESAADEFQPPWEVIRWNRLKKLTGQAFSEVGRRNFGSPTCLTVTDQIVVGTSKGLVLVFDHHQNNKTIIGPGTKAAEAGSVTALAISADHTAIAVGHATGNIFTWDISKPTRPFLQIPAVDATLPESKKVDGHVQSSAVLHIGFLGYRRTALVSADDKGMAFSHLATRGTGALGRSVKTTRILGRYPELIIRKSDRPVKKSSVLAFAPLPLGNVEQNTDRLGLVAMLTPYLLVVVSTTPIAQTQHKLPRPREVAAHSAMTAALAWFPAIKLKGNDTVVSKNKLAYVWSNVLSILDVVEVPREPDTPEDKPVELQFISRSHYKAEEAIVAVQWLSRSVLALLTITQQLLIVEDVTMNVTDSFDLLPKNLYHSDLYSHQLQSVIEHHDDEEEDSSMHGVVADGYYMSFRCYKGRLFLLGFNDIWWGSLTNWADRLLAMMETGDFIGAIRLATNYFSGTGEKATIGLPDDQTLRSSLVRDKLLEMMSASLRYAFGKNEQASRPPLNRHQLTELAVACVDACLKMDDQDFLFEEVFDWYDENETGDIFVDVIEPHILDRQITTLPPAAIKTLINHFSQTHTPSELEEIICLLNAATMDVDQVTNLCKQYRLYDAYIYVWNTALFDYASPLVELLKLASESSGTNGVPATTKSSQISQKIFPYLSFVLTSRVYPLGEFMDDDRASMAKTQIYELLFYGKSDQQDPFQILRGLLKLDTPASMAAMNEAFEDPFLNTGQDDMIDGTGGTSTSQASLFNRLIIVRILLDVMSTGFSAEDRIYLDMFIARNLPKYPQYMLLKGSVLEQVFTRLCQCTDEDLRDDTQLSLEYLMTVYKPANMTAFIPMLWNSRFYRVLKNVYRQEGNWTQLLTVYFVDTENQAQIFAIILEFLRKNSDLDGEQKQEFVDEVKAHASDLAIINTARTARIIDTVMPSEHNFFLDSLSSDTRAQFNYLRTLLEPQNDTARSNHTNNDMLEQYVRLMCQYDPGHVVQYINTVKEGDLELDNVVPALENSGNIDAAVILLAKQGQAQNAIDRLIKHLSVIEGALSGVLDSAIDSPDEVATNEAIEDLLESVDKYAKVGIWLCETQTKEAPRVRTPSKSPRRSSVKQPLSFEESLWLEFIVAIVSIAQKIGPGPPSSNTATSASTRLPDDSDELSSSLNRTIQRVFTALLNTTTSTRAPNTSTLTASSTQDTLRFPRILRAFLSRASETSPSLSHLRHVMTSIFSAYAYESSLLSLSNAMLDKDLFVQVDEVTKLRVQGWRPRGQICGICRRRVWGPGTGLRVWEAWERKERGRERRVREARLSISLSGGQELEEGRGKGKEAATKAVDLSGDEEALRIEEETMLQRQQDLGPVVVFGCRHLFHKRCLERGLGVDEDGRGGDGVVLKLACPLCG